MVCWLSSKKLVDHICVRMLWFISPDKKDNACLALMGSSAGKPDSQTEPAPKLQVTLEDLELPPRRDRPTAALPVGQVGPAVGQVLPGLAGAPQVPQGPRLTEELLPGAEAKGQRAFGADGLVGTEAQQLQLLSHYAELCDDFRFYQRITREEDTASNCDGAQMVLLSGPPGTGKSKHAVSFARALGLPLLTVNPTQVSGSNGQAYFTGGWASQVRQEIRGRDCILFLDEIDQYASHEAFLSGLRQFLDGVCQPSASKVLVLGTTNCIDKLPWDVRHRAEVVSFVHPEKEHLNTMWRKYAKHLKEDDLAKLAEVSSLAKVGRRVLQ